MKIKMVRHYCGYLNDNEDWWPGEEHNAPDKEAKELIEREFAVAIETVVAKAAAVVSEAVKVNRGKK